MRKLACLLAATAVALVGATAAAAITSPETIRLIDVEVRSEPLDGFDFDDDAPPRAGQRFAFTDALYRWQGRQRGAQVGRLEALCTFVKVDVEREAATTHCTAYVYLPAGKLLVEGFILFSEQSGPVLRLPVTGGTGRYANAHGTATLRELPEASALTLRLFPIR